MAERMGPNLNNERRLPVGSGGKTEGYEELPAVHVKNEVVWVNPDLKLPFDLKVGEDTNLGVFLTPVQKSKEPTTTIKAMESHKRSGLLGRIIFEDKEGRLYRDIDLKGLGYSMSVNPIFVSSPHNRTDGSISGIADFGYIETDRKLSEILLKKGLRTHRVVAVIKLKEIVDGRRKITIEEARKRGIISKSIEPVIEVRAFGTKARLADLYVRDPVTKNFYASEARGVLLKDAKALVAQELGKDPNEFSNMEYLNWFLETLGEQLAILHNASYYHTYLTPHNITLDCRIIDLDSVGKLPAKSPKKKQELLQKDLGDAAQSIDALLEALKIPRLKDGSDEVNEEFIKLKLKFSDSYSRNTRKDV